MPHIGSKSQVPVIHVAMTHTYGWMDIRMCSVAESGVAMRMRDAGAQERRSSDRVAGGNTMGVGHGGNRRFVGFEFIVCRLEN